MLNKTDSISMCSDAGEPKKTIRELKESILKETSSMIPIMLTTWIEEDVVNNFKGKVKVDGGDYFISSVVDIYHTFIVDENEVVITIEFLITKYLKYGNITINTIIKDNCELGKFLNYEDFIPTNEKGIYNDFFIQYMDTILNLEYEEVRKE